MGAPSHLTPCLEHALCDLVRQGIPVTDAARGLGIPERTLYRWIYRGRLERGSAIYARFVDGLEAARAEREDHVREMLAIAQTRRDWLEIA